MRSRARAWPRTIAATFVILCLSSVADAQRSPDWSKPPAVGAPRPVTAPRVEQATLANGLQVIVVPRAEDPLVEVTLVSRSGSADEPPGEYGVASLTALLMDGLGDPNQPMKVRAELLGASLAMRSDRQSLRAVLQAPGDQLNPSLELLASFALAPTFSDSSFASLKGRRLASLGRLGGDAGNVAAVMLSRSLYGGGAEGQSSIGSTSGVTSTDLADVVAFQRNAFQPGRCLLILAGSVSLDHIRAVLDRSFGQPWPAAGPSAFSFTRPRKLPVGTAVLVDRPGATQSALRVVALLPPRSSSDYYALEVANMIIGGTTTGRIGRDLHDAHGFTYEAKSMIEWRRSASAFIAYGNVATAVTDSAAQAMVADVASAVQGVTAPELATAKRTVLRTYQDAMATSSGIVSAMSDQFAEGAPVDAYARLEAGISSVNAADVAAVVSKYLSPSTVDLIVIGDSSRVAPGLRRVRPDLQVISVSDALQPPL